MPDISKLPLGHVRSQVGLIAQDPILLSGSLRLNLDPEGQYTDDQLYDSLREVQLGNGQISGTASPEGNSSNEPAMTLDFEVNSGGDKSVFMLHGDSL